MSRMVSVFSEPVPLLLSVHFGRNDVAMQSHKILVFFLTHMGILALYFFSATGCLYPGG